MFCRLFNDAGLSILNTGNKKREFPLMKVEEERNMQHTAMQKQINSYLTEVMEKNFGEDAKVLDITIKQPFILIHLDNFLMASEKTLLKREEEMRILKTRELIMKNIKSDLLKKLEEITEMDIKDIYTDWNLARKTGFITAVMAQEADPSMDTWPDESVKSSIEAEIIRASEKTQKKPEYTQAHWINDHLIVVERRGIMVEIEQELLELGVKEELKVAKRVMEHRMVNSEEFQRVLKQELSEWFVDWNFDEDIAYMVLVCKK